MRKEFNRFMSDPLSRSWADLPFSQSIRDKSGQFFYSPRVDVLESKDSWIVQLDLPGLSKESLKAELKSGNLHVEGHTLDLKEYEKFTNQLRERNHGKFSRVISLPLETDSTKVQADYKNGVLNFKIPKKKESKPMKISIS